MFLTANFDYALPFLAATGKVCFHFIIANIIIVLLFQSLSVITIELLLLLISSVLIIIVIVIIYYYYFAVGKFTSLL